MVLLVPVTVTLVDHPDAARLVAVCNCQPVKLVGQAKSRLLTV